MGFLCKLKIHKNVGVDAPDRKEWANVEGALEEFRTLLEFFLKAEARELANELEPAPDSLLNDLEKQQGTEFQRAQFKAYIMLPDTTEE